MVSPFFFFYFVSSQSRRRERPRAEKNNIARFISGSRLSAKSREFNVISTKAPALRRQETLLRLSLRIGTTGENHEHVVPER